MVAGTLIDMDTKEPLPFAAVKITHKMSAELVTGGMTDAKGRFKVEGITLGPNMLEFATRAINQDPRGAPRREGTEQDLGKIGLQSSGWSLRRSPWRRSVSL